MSALTAKKKLLTVTAIALVALTGWWIRDWQDDGDNLDSDNVVQIESQQDGVRRVSEEQKTTPAAGAIIGRVVDESGSPVAATVDFDFENPPSTRFDQSLTPRHVVATDSDGRFASQVAGYSIVKVQISPRVGAVVQRRFLKLNGEDLDIGNVVVSLGGVVEGEVVNDEGDPIANALVVVGPRGRIKGRLGDGDFLVGIDPDFARTKVSDENGKFRIEGVHVGRVAIEVTCEGYSPNAVANVLVDEASVSEVSLTLKAERPLSVEVREEGSGRLLSGAMVSLSAMDYDNSDQILKEFLTPASVTDGKGKAEFGKLARRRYRLRATAEGYMSAKDIIIAKDQQFAQVTLQPSAKILGRVFDRETNRSIEDFQIRARSASRRQAKIEFEVLDAASCVDRFQVSKDIGYFGVVPSGSRNVVLEISAPGFASGVVEVEDLATGELRKLDVALPKEVLLSGVIRSHEYKLLPDATVTAVHMANDEVAEDAAERGLMSGKIDTSDSVYGTGLFRPLSEIVAKTDEKGRFEFRGLSPGRYQLKASHPKQLDPEPSEYVLVAGIGTNDVEIQMLPAGGIQGLVLDKNGRPVAAAYVSVRTAPPSGATGAIANLALTEEVDSVYADEKGRFVVTGIKPGSYGVIATAPEIGNATGVIPAAGQKPVRVRPGVDVELNIELTSKPN